MVIQSIASSYVSPAAKTRSAEERGIVSKDDFLRLLVTQLQKQDPLNPSEPTEFTSQLAQFSSLEQLIGVNANLDGLAGQQSLTSRIGAASFIGKTVRVNSSSIPVSGGQAGAIRFNLSTDSTATAVNVYNQGGDLVDVVSLGAKSTGAHDFTWDAKTTSGAVADGAYRIEIIAQDAKGQGLPVSAESTGKITGVRFGANGQTLLEIGSVAYTLSDLISVSGN